MAMVCPQCNGSFEQRLHCPRCDVRLLFRPGQDGGGRSGLFSPAGWQQTPWGRILIGLLLAQGLYHGLRHLVTAGVLFTSAAALADGLSGILLMQGLQLTGLTAGALLAGAGQRQGLVYGAVLGVWNGVLLLVIFPSQFEQLTTVATYGQPLIQAAVGGIAGWFGGMIWRPLSPLRVPGASRQVRKPPERPIWRIFSGRVAWVRVVLGSALAIGGTTWASFLLDMLIDASDRNLTVPTNLHARLVTWEIAALSTFFGGALAGATTFNGAKQGLAVGLISGVILTGLRLSGPNPPTMELQILTLVSSAFLCIVGGTFGSQALPPLLEVTKHRYVDSTP